MTVGRGAILHARASITSRPEVPSGSFPGGPTASPANKPENALHVLAGGISKVTSAPGMAMGMLDEGVARLTNFASAVFPSLPAAGLGSIALGIPHAHILHPPSGPAPVPPTPILSMGPVLFGTCMSVLVGNVPAARCGDFGLGATCCGIPAIFNITTGSSNVFIGGARAARMGDFTSHCNPIPDPKEAEVRGLAAAWKTTTQAFYVANLAAQTLSAMGDGIESANAANPAVSTALATSAMMTAAQLAADAVAMAMGAVQGKDTPMPPGTRGMITVPMPPTSRVLIGGIPLPPSLGLIKFLSRELRPRSIRRRFGKLRSAIRSSIRRYRRRSRNRARASRRGKAGKT